MATPKNRSKSGITPGGREYSAFREGEHTSVQVAAGSKIFQKDRLSAGKKTKSVSKNVYTTATKTGRHGGERVKKGEGVFVRASQKAKQEIRKPAKK